MKDIEFLFLFADRNTGKYQPHLGSDFLISLLIKRGYKASRILTDNKERLLDKLLYIKKNSSANIKYVFGFTCYDANYQMVKQGVTLVKSIFESALIFVGGPSATFNADVILNNIKDIDLCFLGESEVSILELADKLKTGKDFRGIENTAYLYDGRLIKHGKNCVLDEEAMNSFPSAICSPTYDPNEVLQRYGKISIITSRGCPHRCSFCAFSLQSDHTVRYYSVERVIEEIKYIDSKLKNILDINCKKIVIEDDCFTLNKKHFLGITNELIKIKPHLLFECQTRADYLNYDILKQLKMAGFYRVDISLESSDEKVLYTNRKVVSYQKACEYIENVSKVIKWCKELSLECYTTLMCGLPEDSIKSVARTHDFIVDNEPTGYYWNNLKVFTGTSMFNDYMEKHIKIRDENIFNPINCNEITYNNISPYDPRVIVRSGDDVSWSDRKQRTKQDVFEYITGNRMSDSYLLRIDVPTDLKSVTKILAEQVSLDSRILLFSEDKKGYYSVNSVLLSEMQAVASFENNSNEQAYSALCDISPTIELPQNELLVFGKRLESNGMKNNLSEWLIENGNVADSNNRKLKEQMMDIIVCLNE